MSYADRASKIEKSITHAILTRAIAKGWTVSVYDSTDSEGEWTVKRSANLNQIKEALASTEGDTLRFRDSAGNSLGVLVLIWGNDSDLVSDHTDNEAMAELTANLPSE